MSDQTSHMYACDPMWGPLLTQVSWLRLLSNHTPLKIPTVIYVVVFMAVFHQI